MEGMHKRGYKNVKPNVRTYNAVMDTIYRSRKGNPESAEALLLKMINKFENGDNDLQPDTFSFNAVIQCYTKSRRPDAGDKAMNLLEKMMDLHKKGVVNPDTRSFFHIIEYYSRLSEKDAPAKAEKLLRTMVELFYRQSEPGKSKESITPNIFCFTAVIVAYTRNNCDAGSHAEEILDLLHHVYAASKCNTKLRPNAFVYNCVLDAYSKSRELRLSEERADEILSILEREYAKGFDEMRPTAKTYILSLICLAKSYEFDKIQKSLKIIQRMKKQYSNGNVLARPNVQAYSILINTAASSNHRDIQEEEKALDVAKLALKQLRDCSYDSPNSITYGSFLKACANLNLPRDILEENAKTAFQNCCEEGHVNEYVISQVKKAVTPDSLESLIPSGSFTGGKKYRWNQNLPPHWSRNVPDKLMNDSKGRSYSISSL